MDPTEWAQARQAYLGCISRQVGALGNILDALLTHPAAHAAIELTDAPAFSRQWPSLYKGLLLGRIRGGALRKAAAQWLPPDVGAPLQLVLDTTSFCRPESPTARDRTLVHLPASAGRGTPAAPGWQCSALALLPATPGSGCHYLSLMRQPSWLTAPQLGLRQLKSVLPLLPERPLLVADRLYGRVAFIRGVAALPVDALIRLQGHRVFYRPPPPRAPGRTGRPPKYGAKFKCHDAATHGPPTAAWTGTDPAGRPLCVQLWEGLALKEQMDLPLAVLEVTHPGAAGRPGAPQTLWLLWISPARAPLDRVVPGYVNRFSIEQAFRFDKQCLLWGEPRVRTPAQFERWTALVGMAHNLLGLARAVVPGQRRPWESAQRPVTLQQVRRGLLGLFAQAGLLAPAPQPRGKSPGRRPGARVPPAKRYPVVRPAPAAAGRASPGRRAAAARASPAQPAAA